jgi:hypothetical protein
MKTDPNWPLTHKPKRCGKCGARTVNEAYKTCKGYFISLRGVCFMNQDKEKNENKRKKIDGEHDL